jgi:hypothetical protein
MLRPVCIDIRRARERERQGKALVPSSSSGKDSRKSPAAIEKSTPSGMSVGDTSGTSIILNESSLLETFAD